MDAAGATSEVTDREVRAELSVLLRSHSFANAPSLSRFLAHLVDRTLAGRTADLKEYSLGVDVFDRGDDFDPKADTIVRVQARRLRAKLKDYYAGEGSADPIVINLDKWHYVPTFDRRRPHAGPFALLHGAADVVPLRPVSDTAAAPAWWLQPRTIAYVSVVTAAVFVFAMAVRGWTAARARTVTVPSEYIRLTDFQDSATAPALSPDGRLVAFIRGGEAFLSHGQIYVKPLPNGEAVQLTSSQNRKFAPAFTPDGSRVSYSETSRSGPGASWDTFTIPILGGAPSLLLSNATGLAWLDPQHVMFAAFKEVGHLGIVTATDLRAEERPIYFPAHARAMAHYAYPSPDRTAVLIVEMDSQGVFRSCRLVPFDGHASGRAVGPDGGCRSAAWSPDGKWMYFGVSVDGHSHLWRQSYPAGVPEQITFGPTEEEGVAVAPDGRSLVTSIGRRQSAIWIHETAGDRPLASEGFAYAPRLARDGRRVYYLRRESPDGSMSELRRVDIASGKEERLLPGLPFVEHEPVYPHDYDVSPDDREVVFAKRAPDGTTEIWLTRLDRGGPPRLIVRGGTYPSFGARDDLFFVTLDKDTSYLTHINKDGSGRVRIEPIAPVHNRGGISPDGEWAIVFGLSANGATHGTLAVPVHGGTPKLICTGLCWGWWSADGRTFYVSIHDESAPERTLVIPLPPGTMVPDLPAQGVNEPVNQTAIPGLRIIDRGRVLPLSDPSQYVYTRWDLLRNLYRVPLH